MTDIATLLANALSPDKTAREAAEAEISLLLGSAPAQLAAALVAGMALQDTSSASLSAVLFRKKLLETSVFSTFEVAAKASWFSAVSGLVAEQRPLPYLKIVVDLLANMSNSEQWAEQYFQLAVSWLSSGSFVELGLYSLEITGTFPALLPYVLANSQSMLTTLSTCMTAQSPQVALSALTTAAALLCNLPENTVDGCSPLATALLETLTRALQAAPPHVEKLINSLSSLAELTEAHPRFWKATAPSLVQVLTSLATATSFESRVRAGSIEVLITLVLRAPGMIKKHSESVQQLCNSALVLLCEAEFSEDLERWGQEEADEVTSNEPFSLGKDLLAKTARSLGGDTVLNCVLATIPAMLSHSDWTQQHAGVLALGLISEGCHAQFAGNLQEILQLICQFHNSSNVRLQWACATSLGLLFSEFEPEIQSQFHQLVLPAVLVVLETGTLPKTCTQGALAVVNYTKGLLGDSEPETSECLDPYATRILTVLAAKLNEGVAGKCPVLVSAVLAALSTTATALAEKFSAFYSSLMPGLMTLVALPASSVKQQEARASCIRTIGNCIQSISAAPAAYTADAATIMNGFLALKNSVEPEDPACLAINEVLSQFADVLKEEFLPYMEVLYTDLLRKAVAVVDMGFTEQDAELPAGVNSVIFDLKGQGTKQLSVNTTVLQHKIKACRILYDLVNSLGQLFTPYIESTVNALSPLLTYTFSADVRKYSAKTLACTVSCCEGANKELVFTKVFPLFLETFKQEMLPNDSKNLLKSLLFACEQLENLAILGLAKATELSNALSALTALVFTRKTERLTELKGFQDPDLYSGEIEELNDFNQTDDKILGFIMELVGLLLKSFKKDFQVIFSAHFRDCYYQLFFKENPTDSELVSALCIFDDYLEHTQDLLLQDNKSALLEQFILYGCNTNPEIRQAAVYGIGLCAVLLGHTFAQYTASALRTVQTAIEDPKARSKQFRTSTDCAVHALGKIVLFQQADLAEHWVGLLPLKAEADEARNCHNLFVKHYEQFKCCGSTENVMDQLRVLARENSELLDQETVSLLIN